MALPLRLGDVPEEATIPQNGWVLIGLDVKRLAVTREFNRDRTLFITYVNSGDTAPSEFDIPKWRVLDRTNFIDSGTARDVYVYAMDGDLTIFIEA